MLIDFYFKNYSSFKERAELNLTADRSFEFSNTLLHYDNLNILPVAAIFGPNESGKSNLIQAFNFCKNKIVNNSVHKQNPYAFTHNISDSSFGFRFILNNNIINYEFTINNKGDVITEELTLEKIKDKDPIQIFKRNRQDIKLSQSLRKYLKKINLSLKGNRLLLNLLKDCKKESIDIIYQWFEKIDIISLIEFSNMDFIEKTLKKLLSHPKEKKKLLNFLKIIDSKIVDIYYDENIGELLTIHDQGKKELTLNIIEESSGILKMIVLYPYITKALNLGLPLFIDDLDEHLHPLLLRYIIVNFLNQETNPYQGQLIFTSHNHSILNMILLRSDEIWFTEKNNDISELFTLADFRDKNGNRIRKDKKFLSEYYHGQFGGVPNIKDKSII